jgi:hypothetical protein
MITKEQLAETLNGREYGNEITELEEQQAKESGLVVVFGYSDDNVELRGAIDEEIGAYNGTTILIDTITHEIIEDDTDDDDSRVYLLRKHKVKLAEIKAIWSPKEPDCSWIYKTEIPHSTFKIMEDGELYCVGMVFNISDLK